ncbi:VaFE repeat-containing surface-anchored protein [Enterococcus sp. DIV0756]|uniref:VaFE repeat-containing surface-anchored protein n=1 Tax=Enterococcus sp. DIV0756 TaxID=2774636 RepID=UPI003F239F6F
MKKFFRGKLSAKLALVAILANTLTSPVGVIAEELSADNNPEPKVGLSGNNQTLESTTIESSLGKKEEQPKIELQEIDTDGKDTLEAGESFTANLKGTFSNLQESSEKLITFDLNSEFVLNDDLKATSEEIQVIKLSDNRFKIDFSQVEEGEKEFEMSLPLSVKSTNEEAKLVLSSDHTQDVSKTFKVSQSAIKTQQATAGKSKSTKDVKAADGSTKSNNITVYHGDRIESESWFKYILDDGSFRSNGKIHKIYILENGVKKYAYCLDEFAANPADSGTDYDFGYNVPNRLEGKTDDGILGAVMTLDTGFPKGSDQDYLTMQIALWTALGSTTYVDANLGVNDPRLSSPLFDTLPSAKEILLKVLSMVEQAKKMAYFNEWKGIINVDPEVQKFTYVEGENGESGYYETGYYQVDGPSINNITELKINTTSLSTQARDSITLYDKDNNLIGGLSDYNQLVDFKVRIPEEYVRGNQTIKFNFKGKYLSETYILLTPTTAGPPTFQTIGVPSVETTELGVEGSFSGELEKEHLDKGKVQITKIDSEEESKKLAGATFKITNSETNEVWLAESDPTSSNGELTITDIPIGKYTLEEVSAPTGYDLSKEKLPFEVTAENAATLQTFNFKNKESEKPKGKVQITKIDSEEESKKLAGATFKITNSETNKVWLAESDPTASNGELTITDIPIGKYTLEEVNAPTGYDVSKEKLPFEVTAENAATLQTFNFKNKESEKPKGKVQITKIDSAEESKKLAGATFKITNSETNEVWLAESDPTASNGELTITDIPIGKYTLEEVTAPTGYDLSKEKLPFEVTAENAAKLQTFNFKNKETEKPKGKVKITKIDSAEESKKLAGATFKITNSETNEVWLAESDPTASNGELTITDIPIGKYTLEEVTAPTGYDLSKEKLPFEVTAENAATLQTFNFKNKESEKPKGKVTIKKYKDGDTTEALIADAEFTLYDSEGKKLDTKVTVEGKELVFDNLEYGNYTLKETKAPAGYDESTEEKPVFVKDFEVTAKDLSFEYKVANKPTASRQSGKVTIKKHTEGDADEKLIGGAEFTLTDSTGAVVAKQESKAGEELVFSNLGLGEYTLEETSAPDGYEKPDFKKTFEVTTDTLNFEYTVYNKKAPEISTTAKDGETGTHEGYADEKVTIIDKVEYKNLVVGNTYTVKGTLMDKATNLPFVTKDGKEVHAEKEFEAKTKDGSVELEFVITNGDLAGKTVVVFETLYHEDKEVAAHTDIDDKDQSVDYPKVGTKASDSIVGDKIVVKDIVAYEKLTVGKEYTIKGTLMDKATSEAFEVDGKKVTAEATFTPTAENGTTEVSFEFDKKAIEGKEISLVVFEKVFNADGKVIGTHEDINDPDQTVEFTPETPEISTTAKDKDTGTNEGYADEKVTIIDKVEYKNLVVGNTYTVKGTLMDKATNQPFLTRDGKEVHAEKEFEATTKDGSVELEFVITNGDLAGKTVVVFETLYHEDKEVAAHTDIEDKDQSVDYPKVGTKASDSVVGDKIIVKDIVSYEKLTVGKEYTIKGTLMDKATSEAFEVDGKKVTAEATFTPTAENGTTEVTFEFAKSAIEGKEISLVVFEKVFNADGKVIGTHEDIDDPDQTVEFTPETPEISTTAKDKDTGTNEGYADEKVTIIDKVEYKNLVVGNTYTVKGTLMDKATNQPFLTRDGKEVHAEKEFEAKTKDGSVELEFVITNGDLAGKTVVVFETLYHEDKEVAAHTDIEDKDQSVDYPKVGTKASDSVVGDKIVVKDIVSYEKLTVGKEYTIKGTLMDKATSEAFEVDGKKVTAEATFTPTAENGTTEVSFEFDKKAIEGKEISLVVFEKVFNAEGKVIGTHEDINDPDQTVEFTPETPEISTTAKDKDTGTNEGYADEKVTIIDKVEYKNLVVGNTYTVKGTLMDKATNQPFLTRDGQEVHAEKEFKATTKDGSVELEFVITNGDLAGKTVVVFETLYHEDKEVAAHTDIEDKDQSVDYPKVGTKASDSVVGDKIVVKDIVSYEKLTVGKEYTIKGTLMDKATSEAFEVDGKKVTAEATFTPEAENGTTEVTFEFAKEAVDGKEITLVVFEKIYNADGKIIGSHEDLEDPDQTVHFETPLIPEEPEISTTAKDSETGTNEGHADEKVSIIDTVTYKNLIVGNTYTVKGVLMDKATNKPFVTRDGQEVRAEKEFIADKADGTIDLEFVITNGDLAGKTVVVFETLYHEDKEVAAHTDIEDKNQSVDYPKVGTKASESTVGDKIVVKDIVSYEKLTVGKAYTVKGVLMDKATNQPFAVNGQAVTAETTFTPEKASGTTEVIFEFDKAAVAGQTISLVVFEKVYNAAGQLIGSHEDINDSDQTVKLTPPDVPVISTKAKDKGTAGNEGQAKKEVTIIDEVSYKNLIVGNEYTVKGVLMDKATNQPLLVNGKEVRAEKTFTAKKPNGTIDLAFTFDGSALAGKTVVVFETLYHEGKEIATHTDIEDKDQTVTYPKVGTKASESTVDDKVVIKDVVSYENLIVGNEYTVKGVLMDKSTGLAYLVDGKKVLGETTFIATNTSGTVEVVFEFAKSALTKKETLVVFEQLFNSKGYLIGTHEDINDKDQTVEVGDDTPGNPDLPNTKTGGRTYSYGTSTSRGSLPSTGSQNNPLLFIVGIIVVASALALSFVFYTRKTKKNS